EDAFRRLPVHWVWWPALGGLAVGLGGSIFPQALGVGYDTIEALLQANVEPRTILGVLLVKSTIWVLSLGSGTSGGVLAPLLMMGGALGGVESLFLPDEGPGFWPLISMGAILGGTMRSPLTGVVFAIELTHEVGALLPLLIAVVVAYGFTVLTMRRSILTEKLHRRGYHLVREYAVDPLEVTLVRDVMTTNVVALSADMSLEDLARSLRQEDARGQRLYAVLDAEGRMVGVVSRRDVQASLQIEGPQRALRDVAREPVVAYAGEPLRAVAHRMAKTGLTRLPVVERSDPQRLVGIVSLVDLLKVHARVFDEEHERERVLRVRVLLPRAGALRPPGGSVMDRAGRGDGKR
ncbi:MAG TPA: chloride channel protein, partial [Chloroflexota bacterium]